MESVFRARVMGLREAAEGVEPREGIADVLVAVFDEPDTRVAVGNKARQVIDHGAFRDWIEGADLKKQPMPLFMDHGDAMITGFTTAAKKLGYADGFRETDDGLAGDFHYNLSTQRGREAWSDLQFDPNGTQFSFRWTPDEEVYRSSDGLEHVKKFRNLLEVSQVGFGAQELTGVLATTVRGSQQDLVLRPHSTDVRASKWDERTVMENLDESPEAFRNMFAWAKPDASKLEEFRFAHHDLDENGFPGSANLAAVRTALKVVGEDKELGDEDREGAWEHLAEHLGDAGEEVPQPPFEVKARHRLHGDQVPPTPKPAVVAEWLKQDESFRENVKSQLSQFEPAPPSNEATSRSPETTTNWDVTPQTWTITPATTGGNTTTPWVITPNLPQTQPYIPVPEQPEPQEGRSAQEEVPAPAMSVDGLSALIRFAWDEQEQQTPSYVVDVWANPDLRSGWLVSAVFEPEAEETKYVRCDWTIEEDKVTLADAAPVEPGTFSTQLRGVLGSEVMLRMLRLDTELANRLKLIVDESLADDDPVKAFYGAELAGRKVLGELTQPA